jgi:4-hydroxybutyryl-CoA synthetase (ADP-forming)
MLASLMGLAEGTENKAILSEGGIPHFMYAEPAIRSLYAMYKFRDYLESAKSQYVAFQVNRLKVKEIFESIRRQGRNNLLEEEGYDVLEAYGFTVPKSRVATSPEECADIAEEFGFPVVLKIASKDIIHKSDAGGVKVGLKDREEVKSAFSTIIENAKKYNVDANIKGVLVQEMITSAKEVILGAKHDPLFGPLIMFGLGGIYVEVLKDVVFRLAPLSEDDAKKMVESIKAIKMLKGVRGEKPADLEAIVESLERLSQLIIDFPEIKEFDMNPLLVLPEGKGVRAVDVRISIENN